MAIEEFAHSPKPLTSGDQIAPGSIELGHLSPGLFSEFRQLSLHSHTGVKSRKIKLSDLEGAFRKEGFILYSNDGTKRYRITIDSSGTLISTEI